MIGTKKHEETYCRFFAITGVRGMKRLEEVLDRLYASEINFSISCFWDNDIDVKLGAEMNGFAAILT